jgi:hypothetical protein
LKTAIFSLIGVIVGAFLATAKDFWFERRRQKKDLSYLAILVVNKFDRFVAGCIEVTRDDGLCYGQRDEQGCKVPQVEHPAIDFMSIDVEWRSLSPKLMYEILNFSTLIEDAKSYISIVTEYEAGPPDYEEYFAISTIKFSELGLLAIELSNKLRELGNLPPANESEEGSSRRELLNKAKNETIEIVEKRREKQQKLINDLKK